MKKTKTFISFFAGSRTKDLMRFLLTRLDRFAHTTGEYREVEHSSGARITFDSRYLPEVCKFLDLWLSKEGAERPEVKVVLDIHFGDESRYFHALTASHTNLEVRAGLHRDMRTNKEVHRKLGLKVKVNTVELFSTLLMHPLFEEIDVGKLLIFESVLMPPSEYSEDTDTAELGSIIKGEPVQLDSESGLQWAAESVPYLADRIDLASTTLSSPGSDLRDSDSGVTPRRGSISRPGNTMAISPRAHSISSSGAEHGIAARFESTAGGPLPTERPQTRNAFGLLKCPSTVVVEQEFELFVGLSKDPVPGVKGPELEIPNREFRLVVQIVAPGFTVRSGESFRQNIEVTAKEPFPICSIHLTPIFQLDDRIVREIYASFTVDGQPLGFADRDVTVVRDTTVQSDQADSDGVHFTVPITDRAADLTVIVRQQLGTISTLWWTFESRHALEIPDHPVDTEIGSSPQEYASRLMHQVNQNQDAPYELLVGHGRSIQQLMPGEFWELLGKVALLSHPPTVLILSEDPFVPWELAVLEHPFDDQAAPFLGAQTVVGRWIQPKKHQSRPRLPPPWQHDVGALAVVSGIYENAPRLREAEIEAEEILADLGRDLADKAKSVDAIRGTVLKCLNGEPAADLLHFSLHGSFDHTGLEDGLLLVDGKYLLPEQVRGVDLVSRPFVFLNACQVGQGNEMLGTYAGMAAAFLFAGASAVIAPLWSINDKVARSIAKTFYDETLRTRDSVSPAEVLRRERSKFVSNEQSATFMAYQFFGHPELILSLGPTNSMPLTPPATG